MGNRFGYLQEKEKEKTGFVTNFTEFHTTTVKFYCRRQLELPSEEIIPIGGAVAWPHLQIGDCALVRVFCRTLCEEAYVPAYVCVLPESSSMQTKLYTLQLYNGVMVHKPRRFIVKIARERYNAVVEKIIEIRHRKPTRFGAMEGVNHRSGKLLRRRSRLALNRSRSANLNKITISNELQRIYGIKGVQRRRRPTTTVDHILDIIVRSKSPSKPSRPASRSATPISSTSAWSSYTDTSNKNGTQRRVVRNTRNEHFRAKSSDATPGEENSPKLRSDPEEEIARNESRTRSHSPDHLHKNSRSNSDAGNISHDVTKDQPEPEKTDTVVVQDSASQHSSILSERNKHKTSSSTLPKVSSVNSIHRNRKLRKIDTGQEVLACWPDDGWYYFSTVVTEIDDERFVVRDSTGHIETISEDNIMTESQQLFDVIQPGDHVIGLHPNFLYSYAPAIVRDVYNLGVRVEFFDLMEARLPFEEVYKLTPGKYKQRVDYIRECTERVCRNNGGDVVARDDTTGFYVRCFAECPTSRSQFFLRMLNGTFRKQSAIHVFERSSNLSIYNENKEHWLYVLAPWDDTNATFLPATVLQRHPLCVKFADGSYKTLDSLKNCFYLSDDYYKNAVNFFIEKSNSDRVAPGRVFGWHSIL